MVSVIRSARIVVSNRDCLSSWVEGRVQGPLPPLDIRGDVTIPSTRRKKKSCSNVAPAAFGVACRVVEELVRDLCWKLRRLGHHVAMGPFLGHAQHV